MSWTHNFSPLPFQGQKRRYAKEFIEVVRMLPQGLTVVDLFGGSGLLSHIAKRERGDLRVIWNDFDNFKERLDRLEETNELLALTDPKPYFIGKKWRHVKIQPDLKADIIDKINRWQKGGGYVDWRILSAHFLFSNRKAFHVEALKKEPFYYHIRKKSYEARGYLAGVERVCADYRALQGHFEARGGGIFHRRPALPSNRRTGLYKRLKSARA